MILILSTPTDYDTNHVIDWLIQYKTPFFRLNDEDLMQGITIFNHNPDQLDETYFEHYSQKIFLKDIKIVWHRKFGFLIDYEKKIGKNNDFIAYLYSEFNSLSRLIFKLLENKKFLCKNSPAFSKIDILNKAAKGGLNTPKTLITSDKQKLSEFYDLHNQSIITKSIGDARGVIYSDKTFTLATHTIKKIDTLPSKFSPSLFQEYIDKEIEIRTFYLDKQCYSMAIFSQNNEKTKIDFRNYDSENPNRFVPYTLPKTIENQITEFMSSINLNTGSLDIIKSSKTGEYYFLEVNPFGQFGMTSKPCNYNLHQKVADYLIQNSN
jgi:ATP-GRASP peptide maturase of grasp-with-spasm system